MKVYKTSRLPLSLWIGILGLSLIVSVKAESLLSGVCIHEITEMNVRMLKECHITSTRIEIPWDQIEKEKGKLSLEPKYDQNIDQLLKADIQPLLILDYANKFYDKGSYPLSQEAIGSFERYSSLMVEHFKGKIRYYEIWNEWNGGCGMREEDGKGTPEGYVALLKRVYPRLKKIDSSAVVLAGGMADSGSDESNLWLEKACKLRMLDYCDGVSIHPYCYNSSPKFRVPEKGFLSRCQSIFQILEKYKRGMPVYITEIGWPTPDREESSSINDESNYLARTYLLSAMFPQIKGVWWYDWKNDGLDPKENEHHFGIVYHDLTPKPAYFVFQDIAAFLKEYRFAERIPVGDDSVYILRFTNEKNQLAWAAWCATPRKSVPVAMDSPIFLPVSMKRAGAGKIKCSWMPAAKTLSHQLRFTVDETPLLIISSGNLKK